jgi:hypothetical protein
MSQQLARIKHLPPVRVTLFWQGEIGVMSHVAMGNFTLWPKADQIGVSPSFPFPFSRSHSLHVPLARLRKIPPAVYIPKLATLGAEALNRINRTGGGVAELFNGIPEVLFLATFAASEM